MRKANVSVCVYTKISNKNPDKNIAICIHLDLPTHPYFLNLLVSFMFHVFFRKKPTWKKDNLMVRTNMSFAFNHLLSIQVRMRFTTEFNPKKISRRNGWTRNRSSQHVSYVCFSKGIKQNYTYSLYRYIQKVIFLGDQERSIKYATLQDYKGIYTTNLSMGKSPKITNILHLYCLIPSIQEAFISWPLSFLTFLQLPVSQAIFGWVLIWDLDFAIWSCIDFMPFAADLSIGGKWSSDVLSTLKLVYIWASKYMCKSEDQTTT